MSVCGDETFLPDEDDGLLVRFLFILFLPNGEDLPALPEDEPTPSATLSTVLWSLDNFEIRDSVLS